MSCSWLSVVDAIAQGGGDCSGSNGQDLQTLLGVAGLRRIETCGGDLTIVDAKGERSGCSGGDSGVRTFIRTW